MSDGELKAVVLRVLGALAPEADMSALRPDRPLRDQLDLDSMDFLNFLIAVDAELQVGIPEEDYPKITSLNACLAYLSGRLREKNKASLG